MALNNYILNGPSTVILYDRRDPFVSWQRHLDTTGGRRGGVDLVAPIGTPVRAATPGKWFHLPNNGTAGNSGVFRHDLNHGWHDVFSHLSRYVGADGQHFDQGDIIGYTGNTGGVDKHLHRHLLDPRGVRQNPWRYFSETSGTAGGSSTPISIPSPTPTRKKNRMNLVWDTTGTGFLVTEDGVMPMGGPLVYNLFYRLINSDQTKSPFANNSTPELFNRAEIDIMNANLRILTAGANAQVAIDPAKLASALKDALGEDLSVTAEIDTATLAAAFNEVVPRIAKAVSDEAAKRLVA
jgi:murein DD-endopeptidase MepM/ murein hydrolase activator NlpD